MSAKTKRYLHIYLIIGLIYFLYSRYRVKNLSNALSDGSFIFNGILWPVGAFNEVKGKLK